MPKSAHAKISQAICPSCNDVLEPFHPIDGIDLVQCVKCFGVWISLEEAAKLWPVFEHTGPWIHQLSQAPSSNLDCPECEAHLKTSSEVIRGVDCNFCPIGHGFFLESIAFEESLNAPADAPRLDDTAEVAVYREAPEEDEDATREISLVHTDEPTAPPPPPPVKHFEPPKLNIVKNKVAEAATRAATTQPIAPAATPASPIPTPLRYSIQGRELQFLRLVLPPGASVVAQQAAFLFATDEVSVSRPEAAFHLDDEFKSYENGASEHLAAIAFSIPFGGSIVVLDFSEFSDGFKVSRDALLCFETTVTVSAVHKVGNKNDKLSLHLLNGKGHFFVSILGAVSRIRLKQGERLHVERSSIVGVTPQVSIHENVSHREDLIRCEGPGEVWIQSHSLPRLKKLTRT